MLEGFPSRIKIVLCDNLQNKKRANPPPQNVRYGNPSARLGSARVARVPRQNWSKSLDCISLRFPVTSKPLFVFDEGSEKSSWSLTRDIFLTISFSLMRVTDSNEISGGNACCASKMGHERKCGLLVQCGLLTPLRAVISNGLRLCLNTGNWFQSGAMVWCGSPAQICGIGFHECHSLRRIFFIHRWKSTVFFKVIRGF